MIFHSPYPDVVIPEIPLTQFVLRHADHLTEKPALIDASSGTVVTYRDLAEWVRSVSSGLASRGFRAGDVFAIYAPNGIEYVISLLAVAALGGVSTTANHLATADELARQLNDAGATWLLTTPDLIVNARLAGSSSGVRHLVVAGEADGAISFADLVSSDPVPTMRPIELDDVVLLPYSSGTTGLPKGVMITHRSMVSNLCQSGVPHKVTPDVVVFCLPPFFHMYGTFILTLVLSGGGTLVFSPRFELPAFLASVERYQVNRAYLVPPVILALANDPIVDTYNLASLSRIVSAAAPLGEELGQRCQDRLSCEVIQGYGLTETSPATHLFPVNGRALKPGSVGPCVPNTECKVMDVSLGIELGPNEHGEIWVRGPQVMKGYLNRPDATAEMIDPDGWLRTGDIGYADADGDFYIVDRLKELIKYKAYQVAPAELEALLLTHPAVADAAVVPIPDDAAGEIPKAWVVLSGDATEDDLMAFVAARVAPYKRIRQVEFTDAIPKSATGKILRRVLKERERSTSAVLA